MKIIVLFYFCFFIVGCAAPAKHSAGLNQQNFMLQQELAQKEQQLKEAELQIKEKNLKIDQLRKKLEAFGVFETLDAD